jgi:archaellum biogenesis ATPase FlaH
MMPAITTWPSLVSTSGKVVEGDWDKILTEITRWRTFAGDKEHPGWSAAIFDPCERGNDNVKFMTALVLDYDGTSSIDAAAELWSDYYGALHTTRKHTPEVHRFRVVLPFTRPVSPFEYGAIWRRVFEKSGRKLDPSPKDAGRFWFVAGSSNKTTFMTRRFSGKPFSPDAILAEPEPQPERPPVQRYESENDAERRASAYLARMPAAISGSGGHAALWSAALALVQGFGLSQDVAFALLRGEYNPRCQPPWTDRELNHKISDACNKARVPHGYKLDEDRDWTPRYDRPVRDRQDRAPVAPVPAPEPPKIKSIGELLSNVFEKAKTPREKNGCPSGHGFIDVMLGGFRRGNVAVLGAQTSWGKSSFSIMTTNATARAGGRVLLVSGEDPEETFGKRIMAARAKVHAIALRDHTFQPEDFDKMAAALDDAETWPFFLNGIGKTAESLCQTIAQFCKDESPDLVIIDYLQAFACEKRCQDRRTEVSHIARCFVDAIKNGNAAGLVFSQLKRLPPGQRPTMNDLKESGDVENMAEHVIVGYVEKDEEAPEHDEFGLESFKRYALIEKNKDGPRVGSPIKLPWDLATASFTPISYQEYQRQKDFG